MNVFDLYATLSLDKSDYDAGLNDAETSATSFGSKLKSGLATAAKVTGTALTVAGAAVGAIAKQSVDAYADFEQLSGGIETLFGDSAQKVMADASEAFKTAGLSANQYMETSIQSAAALINSLGGDQAKAADMMNLSITDMADNVNKMGTSMEAVQNAYRGFSRGNFTMLDNLALGFAGTKEGMEELLAKAKELSGVEYDISSYADIVEAIHVVQTEMGITGTTAKEASETISGSVGAMKSAFTNLVAGLADDNADIDALINNVVQSAETAFNNLLPAFERAIVGIASMIEKLAPVISDRLPGLLEQLLPPLLNAAQSLITGLVKAMPTILKSLIKILPTLISSIKTLVGEIIKVLPEIMQGIVEIVPELIPVITDIITGIVDVLLNNIDLLIDGAMNFFLGLYDGILEALPQIIEKMPEIIQTIVDAIVRNVPVLINGAIQLVTMIVEALPEIIAALVDAIPQIITSIINGLTEALPQIITGLIDLVTLIVQHLPEIIAGLLAAIPQIIGAILAPFSGLADSFGEIFGKALESIKNVFGNIGGWFKDKFNSAKEMAADAFSGIKDKLSGAWEKTKTVFSNVGGWFKDKFADAKEKAAGAWDNVKNVFGGIWQKIKDGFKISDAFSWGKDMLENFVGGIKDKVNAVKDAVKGVAEKIKGFIGFSEPTDPASPLHNFHTFAPDMMKLFTKGIKDNENMLYNQIKDTFDFGGMIQSATGPSNIGFAGAGSAGNNAKIVSLLEQLLNKDFVQISADADGIFNVVRRKNDEYFERTGDYAFIGG